MVRWRSFAVNFKKAWLLMKRYPFNLLSSLLTMYLIFLGIFLGVKYLGGTSLSAVDTLEGIIVGYSLWTLSIFAFSDLSWELTNEAQMGTLEQMYLTPAGFAWAQAGYLIGDLLFFSVFEVAMIVLMMLTTHRYLHFDLVSIVPVLIFTLAPAYGIGFAVGGLALVYKRIQAFFQIVQFVLMGLLVVPVNRMPWARLLPMSEGNALLRQIMAGGRSLWQLPGQDLILLLATGIGYLALGLAAFGWAERVARRRGLLGQY